MHMCKLSDYLAIKAQLVFLFNNLFVHSYEAFFTQLSVNNLLTCHIMMYTTAFAF